MKKKFYLLFKTTVMALFVLALASYVNAQQLLLDNNVFKDIQFNNTVNTVFRKGDTVFVGGAFTSIGNGKTGFAVFNKTTGITTGTEPIFNGTIANSISDGSGGYYVAGTFTDINGSKRFNLARINSNGTLNTSFNSNNLSFSGISSMALYNNKLFVGGNFNTIGGKQTSFGTADTLTGNINMNWPDVTGTVNSITDDGSGGWIIAGTITLVNGIERNGIARIDASGNLTDWDLNINGTVNKLLRKGDTLFIGGSFTSVSEIPRSFLCMVKISTAEVLNWSPEPNSSINAFAIKGDTLFLTGSFSQINDESLVVTARGRGAAYKLSNMSLLPWNPQANVSINDLGIKNNIVFAAFTNTTTNSIGGQSRNIIAALDVNAGNANSWNPIFSPTINDKANSIFINGNYLYVGGGFVYNSTARKIIRFDITDPSNPVFTNWNPIVSNGSSDVVNSITQIGGTIFIGGYFNAVN